MGTIRYVDYKTAAISGDNLFNPFLTKRRSFAHESEARAIVVDYDVLIKGAPASSIKEVPIDVGRLVKAIYVSPESPDWFRDVVANLASKYDLAAPVQHSEMDAEPLY